MSNIRGLSVLTVGTLAFEAMVIDNTLTVSRFPIWHRQTVLTYVGSQGGG